MGNKGGEKGEQTAAEPHWEANPTVIFKIVEGDAFVAFNCKASRMPLTPCVCRCSEETDPQKNMCFQKRWRAAKPAVAQRASFADGSLAELPLGYSPRIS
ncbi:hypothetical protein ABPG77_001647 [Micractinium sp. CCAP 211/92]